MLTAADGWGQSFTTINYSLAQGMPSAEVYEVLQDKKGFLWFATDNGVARFDGYEIEKFGVEQGLTDPVVFGFFEDYKGRIWFRTFSGKLSYYDYSEDKIIPYAYNDKLTPLCKNHYIRNIYIDSLDQVFFSVNLLWGKIDSVGNIEQNIIDNNCWVFHKRIGNNCISGYCSDLEYRTHATIDDKTLPFTPSLTGRPHTLLSSVQWKGKFYFSINEDLFEYDETIIKKVLTTKSGIISLSIDREDNLWIGMYEGVERHSPKNFEEPLRLHDFDNVSVTEVIQDHQRGLWITTIGRGVFHIPDFNIKNHEFPTSEQLVTATLLDDRVLIGVKKGGILAINTNTHQVEEEKKFPLDLYNHFVDSKKNVWVSTGKGTYILDAKLKVQPDKPILNRTMLNLYEDSKGQIWTVDKTYLLSFDYKGKITRILHFGFYYRSIMADETNIYLLARTGIHVYDKQFNQAKNLTALEDYKFSKILNLNDTTLLLSSIGNGFFLLNKKNWQHTQFNARNKFVSNDIYTALVTGSTVWLGTEKGIIQTDVESLLKGDPSFRILSHKSGLIADKLNLLMEIENNIWAFFDHGYSVIPKDIITSGQNPLFYISDISVNDKPLAVTEINKLPHTDNNLTVNFGFIDYSNQNIFTRYRFTTEDRWNYTTERSLKFYSLSPGTYKFEFEYSIDNTHWMPSPISPQFSILPPFWQTWYFQTALGLLVMTIIFFYFKFQADVYRRHQQKLIQSEIEAIELERSRIAKDMHDSVGTDFSAIKMMVSQALKKHNEPKSEEIEEQFQNTIQDIKSIIYGLAPPGIERYGLVVSLNNYIARLNGTIPIKIEMNAFGPEIKDPKLSITIFRILQELISNSLKHSKASTITLHISSFEDLLNIVYEDNGKGFTPHENSTGLGLYSIESRLQTVNGRLHFDSGAFGVSYTLDVPLNKHKT